MRIFSKLVAVFVAVALSATPLLAAIPCPGQMAPAAHCAPCCPMMANGMAEGMTEMAAPSGVAALQDQASIEQPPCCTASSSDSSVPAILPEAQGPVPVSALVSAASALPDLLPALLQGLPQPLPDRTGRSRVHSLLCTFRI